MTNHSLTGSTCTLALALALVACGPSKSDFGSLEPGTSPSAERHRANLELPPDLVDSSSDAVRANQVNQADQAARETQQVLPEIEDLSIERNDDEGWLEVDADADVVWQRLVQHWDSLDIELVQANPRIGVMETDWVLPEEARERQARDRFLGNILDTLLDDIFNQATALDKYTIQLERRETERTRINVAHKGLKKIQTQEPTKQYNEEFEWVETEEEPEKIKRALTSIAYGLNGDSS